MVIQEREDGQLANFDAFVRSLQDEWHIPGLAIAILKNGDVLYRKGIGLRNQATGHLVDTQTLFPIGSCTKAFTTAMVAMLVDQEQIDWDTPIKAYLPTFELCDPRATVQLTPRDLVTHRSGLPRHDLFWYHASETRQELFNRLRYLELSRPPRVSFQYSNLSYLLIGQLICQVTGQSWEETIRQQLLIPLEMTNTSCSIASSMQEENCSRPYEKKGQNLQEIPYYTRWEGVAPAGALVSCIDDLCTWVLFQLRKGLYNKRRLISCQQATQIHSAHISVSEPSRYPELSPASYGLGWMIRRYRGHLLIQHGGTIDGFSALITMLPQDDIGCVVLMNREETSVPDILTYSVCDRLLNLREIPWSARLREERRIRERRMSQVAEGKRGVGTTIALVAMKKYTGTFFHPGYGDLIILVQQQSLLLIFHQNAFSLEYCSDDIFWVNLFHKRMCVTFFRDGVGKVNHLALPLEPMVRDIVFIHVQGGS